MLFFLALSVFNISSLLAISGFPLSINSDYAVGSEYLEREPSKLYPSYSSMHSYHPFPLGYQDASPAPGIPLQWGFRHVSCSHYHGGGLVSAILTSFWVSPYSICSCCFYISSVPGSQLMGAVCPRPIDRVQCAPLGVHMCRQVQSRMDRSSWAMACAFQNYGLKGSGSSGKKEYRHISDKPENTH